MRVLLVNPPYQTLTSNVGVGHQVPLGLLMVGGALIDAGHHVELLDAEALRLSVGEVARRVGDRAPDVVMSGHAGSTPAHPVTMEMFRAIRRTSPDIATIYGGVFPSYLANEILRGDDAVDVIVRGEGEATAVDLLEVAEAMGWRDPAALARVESIAFRADGEVVVTPTRQPIRDFDRFRTGWELIDDWNRYQCFGLGRAAIVQFSRGCPHRCTYCGQHQFWQRWRRRDPERVADEIAMLHDVYHVRFVTLADENPTTLPDEWERLLRAIAARRRNVHFFATIRAADIVRDASILPLYREAGILYVLMGIDATDPVRIEAIHKGSTTTIDAEACRLLRANGIRSIIGHVVGLGRETSASFRQAWGMLRRYDGDLLNVMYATPHAWTVFARESATRRVVQRDQRRWDYRHQVLEEPAMRPWKLFAAVKLLELAFHLRPGRVWRMLRDSDRFMRRQLRWTALHMGTVWLGEIVEFVCAAYTDAIRKPVASGHVLASAAATRSSHEARSGNPLAASSPQRRVTPGDDAPPARLAARFTSTALTCSSRGSPGAPAQRTPETVQSRGDSAARSEGDCFS